MIPLPGCAMTMINVHFHSRIFGILDLPSYFQLGGVYREERNDIFDSTSREAAREYCLQPVGWQRSLTARIELVLLEILRKGQDIPERRASALELVQLEPVLNRIETRLGDPDFSVAEMSAVLDVSEVYLRVLFRSRLGISPVRHLRRRRINLACTLLRESGMPIREIAEQCGFREVQFFHRVFREITETTPAQYRENLDY